jgi:FlaA1/EpsC-like NDP-sugar epimerase
VLVTGAGGSIGSELCRQIAHYAPHQLILLGHGENSIFEIHNELAARFPALLLSPVIADIRDSRRIATLFDCFTPEVVFHAAAHKHVPLMEQNPVEAVTNNVFGTANVLAACEALGVARCVLVSTDKAVRPVNVMGATKRLAELLLLDAARRTGRAYAVVRFGNVLGSRGSVAPIFQSQIAAGGPVTVTHPEMKRYFMTIPEAVQLILRAGALGKGGEVFVLDMGEQVKIADLARDMIRLSGLEVGRDIDIVFTGIRPGEKLEEELFFDTEAHQPTTDELIFVAQDDANPLPNGFQTALVDLETCAGNGDEKAMLAVVQQLIPEFQLANNIYR